MKTINGKPFKHKRETKLWDKRSEESAVVTLSVAAIAALKSNSESNIQPAACEASFYTIVQNGVQDVFYKFSHWLATAITIYLTL